MIFIVVRAWRCACRIAKREGLIQDQWVAWTPVEPADYKIRGIEDPTVWISDCGRLTDEQQDLIKSRYRNKPSGDFVSVRCVP